MKFSSQKPDEVAKHIADQPQLRAALQKRVLTTVIASQVLGGAGLAAGITVGALLAQEMLANDNLTGLPVALFTLGAALASFTIGQINQRKGRRFGLGLGFATGGIGALGVVAAAATNNVWLLFICLFIYGAGSASNLQARYSGTDLAEPHNRAKSASIALVSTTFGAVAGPNLVTPMGNLVENWGIPALAGPFLLAGLAYLAAGTVLLIWLKPDPFLVARELLENHTPEDHPDHPSAHIGKKIGRGAFVGAAIMFITQVVMVSIMSMTPVRMQGLGYDMRAVGFVIGAHIAAMYLPSIVTGSLVDRIGRIPMSIASALTLLAAGILGAVGTSFSALLISLILLGIGWNFGLIAGTALVVDATTPARRPRIQGSVDVFVTLGSALGGAFSGVIVANIGFGSLATFGGIASLIILPLIMWLKQET